MRTLSGVVLVLGLVGGTALAQPPRGRSVARRDLSKIEAHARAIARDGTESRRSARRMNDIVRLADRLPDFGDDAALAPMEYATRLGAERLAGDHDPVLRSVEAEALAEQAARLRTALEQPPR